MHGKTETHVACIEGAEPTFPGALGAVLGRRAPKRLFALGNLEILKKKMVALFCSIQCPGNLILKTYDLAREIRDSGITVIGGFHSPMERECLSLLLRGKQPIVWCLAKRLAIRGLPKEDLQPLEEGRLLILSPFGERVDRATQQTALFRNEVVAALADRVFVSYAAPGGKTESFCRRVVHWHKQLFTFDVPETASLRSIGAQPIQHATNIMGGGS
jgi:predicted Rossmann fold nucleotide-binding protein DprA/Smf involved in DNA uptake